MADQANPDLDFQGSFVSPHMPKGSINTIIARVSYIELTLN
jgi:hypothetical protein